MLQNAIIIHVHVQMYIPLQHSTQSLTLNGVVPVQIGISRVGPSLQ